MFIMEFAPGGELKDYVQERGHLEEEVARPLFAQVPARFKLQSKYILSTSIVGSRSLLLAVPLTVV